MYIMGSMTCNINTSIYRSHYDNYCTGHSLSNEHNLYSYRLWKIKCTYTHTYIYAWHTSVIKLFQLIHFNAYITWSFIVYSYTELSYSHTIRLNINVFSYITRNAFVCINISTVECKTAAPDNVVFAELHEFTACPKYEQENIHILWMHH